MAVMERNGEKAVAERGTRGGRRDPVHREAVRERLDHALGATERQQVDFIPTGSIALDLALGVGGVPRGRITEIFGPESSGKTTVCQHIIAEAQRKGGVAAFIDVEHALDPGYARACGVNVDELLVSQPDTGEQALEITETLIRSGGIDVVVVDSVAALVPRAEIEGEMGDSFVGIQARLMSQALRKLTGAVSRSNTSLVFTNQLREKIGVMFGNPETTPGGRALKFYASVRLDIRRVETIKSGQDSVGNRVRVKVVKNKVAPPFRVAEFDVMYGEGISKEGGLLDVGVAMDVVDKTGAWFTYAETRLGQGREASKDFLRQNPADRHGDRGQDPRQGRRRRRAHFPSRASKKPSTSAWPRSHGDAEGASHEKRRAARRRAEDRDRSCVEAAPAVPRVTRSARSAEVRRRARRASATSADLVEGAIDAADRARDARRPGVRAGLDRVARPGPARGGRALRRSSRSRASIARPWTGRSASARRRRPEPMPRRSRPPARAQRAGPATGRADPRDCGQRAYALLARNGFDPDTAAAAPAPSARARSHRPTRGRRRTRSPAN